MKKALLLVIISIFNFHYTQSLNEDIVFENLSDEDKSQIEKINKLLPQSKIITKKECNQYALKQYGCIDNYTIIYLYNNRPINKNPETEFRDFLSLD